MELWINSRIKELESQRKLGELRAESMMQRQGRGEYWEKIKGEFEEIALSSFIRDYVQGQVTSSWKNSQASLGSREP